MTGPEYATDDLVEVRYPMAGQGQADRVQWPWRPGVIVERAG
jgi:hypothetical protein